MRKIFLFVVFVSLVFSQTQRKAFVNGKIYTVNTKQPYVECVVTEAERIIFAGSRNSAEKYIDKNTRIIDLKGKLMLPGFIDNHVHFISGGFYLNGLDLRKAKSVKEFQNLLLKYAQEHPGEWITGGDWDHEAWDIKEPPTRYDIDAVVKNTPVFVSRFDGHMAVANSAALKLAGITKESISPEGGLIVKDPETGEPTGLLKDNAMLAVFNVIPEPSEAEYDRALFASMAEAKKYGVTSIHDITYKNDLRIYQKFERNNDLTIRIYSIMPVEDYQYLVKSGIQYGFGSDYLRIGALKAFADGSLGSSTAWFMEPYEQDPTTSGLPNDIVKNGNLEKWVFDADKNKLQVCTHAIGDAANDYMLTLYEKVISQNPEWDRRFRIEHAQHVRFEDINRFAKSKVIAAVQPYHCIDDGVWAEKRIGPERIKYTYPFRNFLDAGVTLCFGSDWTVAPINPLLGIYAAVTRRTLDEKNPDGWIPEQKITVEEAIRCYTINNAFASFQENDKGTIEEGKFADFVVLSDDILSIDPVKIKDVKVLMTVVGGKVVYEFEKE